MQFLVFALQRNIAMYLNDPFITNKQSYKEISEKLNLKPEKVKRTIEIFFSKLNWHMTRKRSITIRGLGRILPDKIQSGRIDKLRYKLHLLRLQQKVKRLRIKKTVNNLLKRNNNVHL